MFFKITLKQIKVKPSTGFVIPVNTSQQFRATGVFEAMLGSGQVTNECVITDVVAWQALPTPSIAIAVGGLATTTATGKNAIASPCREISDNTVSIQRSRRAL